jgi:hypothetical protein
MTETQEIKRYRITKLNDRTEYYYEEGIGRKWDKEGAAFYPPEVGERFVVFPNGESVFGTSLVMSVYKHGEGDVTGIDKLTLPNNFPVKDVPNNIEIKMGDYLLSTLNSIYLVREVKTK